MGASNELIAFKPLWIRSLTNMVESADALHSPNRHVEYLHERGADWMFDAEEPSPASTRHHGAERFRRGTSEADQERALRARMRVRVGRLGVQIRAFVVGHRIVHTRGWSSTEV